MAITVAIDRTLEKPIHAQLADQTRELVASGLLAPGTVLPPARRLAADLGVERNIVARAYRLLEYEGLIVFQTRAGVSVAEPPERTDAAIRAQLAGEIRKSLARLHRTGIKIEELRSLVDREISALGTGGEDESNE